MSAPAEPPPLRTCPTCGRQARTPYERCPSCGRSYFETPRATVRRRRVVLASAAVVVVAAVAVLAVLLLRSHTRATVQERARTAERVAALRARLVRIQAPHRGSARSLLPAADATPAQRLAARRALVVAVQDRITADARARARAGELDGPIASTECGPFLRSKEAVPDDRDLRRHIGRYDCIAIKGAVQDGRGAHVADIGHPFVAALDFDTFTYTWCRNTPAQSEAGVPLVFVRLQRACLAARGRAMGTGYADVPDRPAS
ncbi:hypothetical protein FSW04_16420 [Baekduia soli]|uniref:Uncharacterized protein n=1 Tax=Baekduia soli TaxID=496014 RepID=A0A5B8U863_9ACTN|nr:hypothetical protein [Baekduia soli]QEC48998.1 hypothetical protein FSW04_16420 [Baekduia soli]